MSSPTWFLARPGQPGTFGALMDEYAKAADELSTMVEHIPDARILRELDVPEKHTRSIRAILAHCVSAAYRYADYIREVRKLAIGERVSVAPDVFIGTGQFRPALVHALRYTEAAIEGLETADDEALIALRFVVRWGPTYDPEMILEHGIVHLLRHRRQIQRWPL